METDEHRTMKCEAERKRKKSLVGLVQQCPPSVIHLRTTFDHHVALRDAEGPNSNNRIRESFAVRVASRRPHSASPISTTIPPKVLYYLEAYLTRATSLETYSTLDIVKFTTTQKHFEHQSITMCSLGVQAAGGSLATALRDRQAYVIPIQPNRSLPVHPAPQHTPSRSAIVKSSLGRVVTAPFIAAITSPCVRLEATNTGDDDRSVSEFAGKELEDKAEPVTRKKTEVTDRDQTSSMNIRTFNRELENIVTTSDSRVIDITRSPDRIDLSGDLGSDEVSIIQTKIDCVPSSRCWNHEGTTKEKRKRRRRHSSTNLSIDVGNVEDGCKTVPPLRLKKIQTLREHTASGGPSWQGIPREIDGRMFTVDPEFMGDERSKNNDNCGGFCDSNDGCASKYRIVTGHTPPYEDDVDSATVCQTTEKNRETMGHKDPAKLRYRQSKLKFKLRELRRKTVDLGKEMLRTVLTTSTAPRGCRLRQTMSRYEEQIESLEKLLNELPKAAAYVEGNINVDWKIFEDSVRGNVSQEPEQHVAVSPARTLSSSASSSLRSSPSLEPPKLSPRSPTNYEANNRSPSQFRDSPPILPRVYITIADCTEDTCELKNVSRRGSGRGKRRTRTPEIKQSPTDHHECSVISTTTTIMNDNLECVEPSQNPLDKTFLEIEKTDLDAMSCYLSDEVEVYEDPKLNIIEMSNCSESPKDVKPLIKCSANSPEIVIDTTSVEQNYEEKPQFPKVIDEPQVVDVTTASPPITSSCGITRDDDDINDNKEQVVNLRDEVVEKPIENNISISEQFPTLGSWIARLSKKQVPDAEASSKVPENETTSVEERPSAFQVFSSDAGKTAVPEVLQNSSGTIAENNVVPPQWSSSERWQEPSQDQQQPLRQSYGPTLPLPPPPPPPPSIGQEFCSPIAMARLYTRNYAIDPYSMAYSYNPAIAAAAATASLWNSAAILQYPLMRPGSAILNGQSPRIPPANLQFPSGHVPQRPSYRVSMMQQNEGKRSSVDPSRNYNQRDAKLLATGLPTSFDHAKRTSADYQYAVAARQARSTGGNPVNGQGINYRTCLQQQQQQSQEQQQFARTTFPDSAMRFPVPGAPWRTSHVLNGVGTDCNFGTQTGWSTGPGNIVNSFQRNSTSGFPSPPTVLSMNSSQTRMTKEAVDAGIRNCETPNLGKVNYSPNTVNNLECSNCGLAGSMFKCLGCEVAFYCDENCQTRHWNRHVISCPKKMPKLKKLVQ